MAALWRELHVTATAFGTRITCKTLPDRGANYFLSCRGCMSLASRCNSLGLVPHPVSSSRVSPRREVDGMRCNWIDSRHDAAQKKISTDEDTFLKVQTVEVSISEPRHYRDRTYQQNGPQFDTKSPNDRAQLRQ